MLHKIKYSLSSIHNTLFTGKVLICHNTLPSTNAALRNMLQQGPVAEGTVVWATHQTAGKGQGNKTWQSEPGQNLTFSLLYRPVFLAPSDIFLLNKVVALALYDTLEPLLPGKALHIKWPNDLLIEGRKTAGILIEIGLRKNVETAIIGIGLNIQQTAFPDLPDATSIAIETGRHLQLEELLTSLLQQLEAAYLLLRSQPGRHTAEQLHQRYEQHLWAKGTLRQFRRGAHTFLATVQGVDKEGKLVLLRNGVEERFQVGEISWK
jgi:BirA family biotin operon repressor/biotin-[acetyl-CoA-carboxylase] ligase